MLNIRIFDKNETGCRLVQIETITSTNTNTPTPHICLDNIQPMCHRLLLKTGQSSSIYNLQHDLPDNKNIIRLFCFLLLSFNPRILI